MKLISTYLNLSLFATVEGMIRRVDNGKGEMSYANRVVASGDLLLFEGGNKVTRTGYAIQGGVNKRSYLPPVIVSNTDGTEPENYAWQGDFFGFDAEAPSYLTFLDLIKHGDTYTSSRTYDAGLRQTNQNYGNGLKRVITYSRKDNLRSTDRVISKDDLNFSYTYAADKQVTAESIVADQVEDTSFTASYDAGNRLTAWNRAGADENHSQTWNYDDAGNWNSTTKDGDTEGRNHSVSNQITQLDGKAVSHDLKGNLTEYEYDRTDYRVKYDLDNRIVEVKADSETIRYRYDALGRRIVSKGDDETVLIWWGDSECAEYEHRASKDAIQNDIMGHPTRLNSVIARDTEDRENRVELQWYHKNYLDHVYAVSDDNGNLVEHYRYTAFGEPEIYSATGARRNTSAIGNTVMWNTRRYDADNGLYYYKYRHYAANIGRWLGRDPLGDEAFLKAYVKKCNEGELCSIKRNRKLAELTSEGQKNLYVFVGNMPVNMWDELGLKCTFSHSYPVPNRPPFSATGWRSYKYCVYNCQKTFLCFKVGKPSIKITGPIHNSLPCP